MRQLTNVPTQTVFRPNDQLLASPSEDDDDEDDEDEDDGGEDDNDDDEDNDDGDEDDDDVNAADTCSLGLLQRPGGQKIRQIKRNACHFQQPVMMLFSILFFCIFQYFLVFISFFSLLGPMPPSGWRT